MSELSLSVVIPAYNAEETISRAIRSAEMSAARHIVVVDDGSTDNTADIAKRLGCRVIRQENRGAAQARLAGLSAAESDLLIFLDADDELLPQGVAQLRQSMTYNTNWSGVHGLSECVSPTEIALGNMGGWREGINIDSLLQRAISPGPAGSFIWKTELLRSAVEGGPRAIWPRFGEDYELLLRVALRGQIGQSDATVCRYKVEGGKSAVAPFRDNVAAERIRRLYAKNAGIGIRQRTLNELRSMGHLRDAYALSWSTAGCKKIRHFALATIHTPLLPGRLIFRKLLRTLRR